MDDIALITEVESICATLLPVCVTLGVSVEGLRGGVVDGHVGGARGGVGVALQRVLTLRYHRE